MRTVYCYDKKKYPKLETKERVFYLNNLLRKAPIPQLPLIYEISAFKDPIQVVEENLTDWRSMRHYQNLSENGAMSERFTATACLQIL